MNIDLVQFFTILAAILGGCAYIRKEIRSDIEETKNESKAQAARTDKLYEMFCELQKNSDQKFYDLLKEKK